MTLSGRTALVTGATSGVGLALARLLAGRGARVLVHGRRPDRLAEVAAEVGGTPIEVDLAEPGAGERLAARARAATGDEAPLSVVVHNAAVQVNGSLLGQSPGITAAAAVRELAVDLVAPVESTAWMLPDLRAAARPGAPAVVVFVTSGLALAPKASAPAYCGAKAGLRMYAKALRYQMEDDGGHVRVVEAMLPLVDTAMTAGRETRVAKIPAAQAAAEIADGIERGHDAIRVGKAALFARLHRWAPRVAERMLRDG